MGHAPKDGQDLLGRVDQVALAAIIRRLLLLGGEAEIAFHLHRPILGARGYNGLTCIVSAQYSAQDGCCGWIEVLLKWSVNASQDARWYPALLAAGAPIPDLHGILPLAEPPTAGSGEVLVLEYLPHIGYTGRDYGALAEAIGRFHALPCTVVPGLPQVRSQDAVSGWQEVWNRIRTHALAGDLGAELTDFIARHAANWDRAAASMTILAERADALTRGLIHRDLSTQNTGWRHGRSQLLLFDLPQMAIGPLAQDAQALFPEGSPWDDGIAQRYLNALQTHGGPRLSMPDFVREIATARALPKLNFLWWATARSLDGKVDFTDDIEQGKRWYRRTLLRTLESAWALLMAEGPLGTNAHGSAAEAMRPVGDPD